LWFRRDDRQAFAARRLPATPAALPGENPRMKIDPASVILLMGAHLLICGVLYRIAAYWLPRRGGFEDWGSAGILFGSTYLLRLHQGLDHFDGIDVVAANTLMQLGAMLVARGFLRQTGLRLPGDLLGSHRSLIMAWLAVTGAYLLVWAFAPNWQYVFFSTTLNLTAVGAGLIALVSIRHVTGGPRLRVPIAVAGVLLIGLAGLGMTRSLAILLNPVPIYQAPHAGLFFMVVALGLIVFSYVAMWIAFADVTRSLQQLVSLDALTGVLNRRGLSEAIANHFRRPDASPLILLQIDIDHFKAINDIHGHDAGDRVLIAVARVLRMHCRTRDFVARTGGEEFLIGCSSVRAEQALQLAESLRGRVGELRVELADGGRISCTVSVGVSMPVESEARWESAWREADAALYRAKARGRNRTEAPPADLAPMI